jgi:DNA-binding Lrp family transcriptional regulator
MKAYVLVKTRIGSVSDVVRRLQSIPGVLEVDGTFGIYDAVVQLEADTLDHLGAIVFNEIQTTAGVESTNTLPVVMR